MDINYKILWFEDTDSSFDTLSRRTKRYIESKNLICQIDRINSKNDFNIDILALNNYEVLIIDLRLANHTTGYDVINEIRSGGYVNDVLFYSAEGEGSLSKIMEEHRLEGVFITERDNRKFIPKLQLLIDKSIRRAENVINIRGIVMDITSEFDINMVDIINLSKELLGEKETKDLKEYIFKELLKDRGDTMNKLMSKYDVNAKWEISDLLEEREFASMMKARLLNKLLNIDNATIKSLAEVCEQVIPEACNDSKIDFFSTYNERVLQFRNALAHVKSNSEIVGPVFIKTINGKDYYCNQEFCYEIRNSLINFSKLFSEVKNKLIDA